MKFKNIILSSTILVSIFAFAGCTSEKKVEQTPEQKFVKVFETEINNRWSESDKIDSQKLDEDAYKKAIIDMVEQEVASLKLASENLTDVNLKEIASNYIKGSELQIESFKTNDFDLLLDYQEKSDKLRKPALVELVEKYGVVIKEEHQQTYKDFKESANIISKETEAKKYAEKLALEITFKKINQEYSEPNYETIIENTSDINFTMLSFKVKCKDKDGVVLSTETIYLENFEPGTKEKAEIFPYKKGIETLSVSVDSVYLD